MQKPKNLKTEKPENQKTRKPKQQKTKKTKNLKTNKPENPKNRNPEIQNPGKGGLAQIQESTIHQTPQHPQSNKMVASGGSAAFMIQE